MGSQATQKLPVIDLSKENLEAASSCWQSTAKDICNALEEYSCSLAVFDKVPSSNPLFASLKGLFDLPLETKMSYTSDLPFHGYLAKKPPSPLYESLAIKDGTSFEEVSRFTTTIWPSGNDHYCNLLYSYAKEVAELDKMIMKMLFESYGVENSWEDHLNSTIYSLTMNKYSAPKPEETKFWPSCSHGHGFQSVISTKPG